MSSTRVVIVSLVGIVLVAAYAWSARPVPVIVMALPATEPDHGIQAPRYDPGSTTELRLAALERGTPTAPAPAPASHDAGARERVAEAIARDAGDGISIEEHVANERARFQSEIDAHDAEPIDPHWARHAEQVIGEDLRAGAERLHFSVAALDCRDTTCVATLEWPNYAAATSHSYEATAMFTRGNCSRESQRQPPTDPNEPYRMQELFNCAPWKAEGEVGQ